MHLTKPSINATPKIWHLKLLCADGMRICSKDHCSKWTDLLRKALFVIVPKGVVWGSGPKDLKILVYECICRFLNIYFVFWLDDCIKCAVFLCFNFLDVQML